MNTFKITVLSLGLVLSGQVIAQTQTTTPAPAPAPEKQHDPAKLFAKLDTNGDGSIDKTEFTAAAEKREEKKDKDIDIDKQFSKTDTNGDGLISKEEFIARKDEMKAHHDAKKEEKQ